MSRHHRLKLVYDILGRPHYASCFRQGSAESARFNPFHLTDFPDDSEALGPIEDGVAVIARLEEHKHVLVEKARLTPKQRRVVEQVIFRGRTLEDVADEESELGGRKVSPQALWYRIKGTRGYGGIRKKAPVLYCLWIFRNRHRHDISEFYDALNRAVDSLHAQPHVHSAEAEAHT